MRKLYQYSFLKQSDNGKHIPNELNDPRKVVLEILLSSFALPTAKRERNMIN